MRKKMRLTGHYDKEAQLLEVPAWENDHRSG